MSDEHLKAVEDLALRCQTDNMICAKQEVLDLVREVRRLKAQLSPPCNPYDGLSNYC